MWKLPRAMTQQSAPTLSKCPPPRLKCYRCVYSAVSLQRCNTTSITALHCSCDFALHFDCPPYCTQCSASKITADSQLPTQSKCPPPVSTQCSAMRLHCILLCTASQGPQPTPPFQSQTGNLSNAVHTVHIPHCPPPPTRSCVLFDAKCFKPSAQPNSRRNCSCLNFRYAVHNCSSNRSIQINCSTHCCR